MRIRTKLGLLTAALLWGCQPQRPQVPMDVTAAIQAANARFTAAFGAHDAHAVAALYTEDAKLLPPNSEFVVGQAAIQTFWQGAMDAGVAVVALTTDEALGTDSMAVEVGHFRLSGAAGATIDEGKYMVWWKRGNGGWRLHRDTWNTSKPAS